MKNINITFFSFRAAGERGKVGRILQLLPRDFLLDRPWRVLWRDDATSLETVRKKERPRKRLFTDHFLNEKRLNHDKWSLLPRTRILKPRWFMILFTLFNFSPWFLFYLWLRFNLFNFFNLWFFQFFLNCNSSFLLYFLYVQFYIFYNLMFQLRSSEEIVLREWANHRMDPFTRSLWLAMVVSENQLWKGSKYLTASFAHWGQF